MSQRTMFPDEFSNPVAHAADPESSRVAAEAVTVSGRRARHAQIVLALVRRYPLQTAIELWTLASADQFHLKESQEIRRRLVDLEAAGLVRKAGQRHCSVRGTLQGTWEA